jgi:hypothetical protein
MDPVKYEKSFQTFDDIRGGHSKHLGHLKHIHLPYMFNDLDHYMCWFSNYAKEHYFSEFGLNGGCYPIIYEWKYKMVKLTTMCALSM